MTEQNPNEIYLEPNIYPTNMERQWCEHDVFSSIDYDGNKSIKYVIADDNRLSEKFETALAALIEHHGADALTSLAAVMRISRIAIGVSSSGVAKIYGDDFTFESSRETLTANDIKLEK